MTKQEIEKAIENGESVLVANKYCLPYGLELTRNYYVDMVSDKEGLMLEHLDHVEFIDYLDCVFKTKEKAQHYHDHANVERVETLPFLTWEEFKKEHYFGFYSIYNEWIDVYVTNGLEPNKLIITIENATKEEFINNYDLTEENFYKAYDECVRLFRCGE